MSLILLIYCSSDFMDFGKNHLSLMKKKGEGGTFGSDCHVIIVKMYMFYIPPLFGSSLFRRMSKVTY